MDGKNDPDIFASPTSPQPWEEAEIEADKLRNDMRDQRGEQYMYRTSKPKLTVKEVFINFISGVVMLAGAAVVSAVCWGAVALVVSVVNSIRDAL